MKVMLYGKRVLWRGRYWGMCLKLHIFLKITHNNNTKNKLIPILPDNTRVSKGTYRIEGISQILQGIYITAKFVFAQHRQLRNVPYSGTYLQAGLFSLRSLFLLNMPNPLLRSQGYRTHTRFFQETSLLCS